MPVFAGGHQRRHALVVADADAVAHNLGGLLQDQKKLDQAEPLLREAVAGNREIFGDRDPNTLASINNLGSLLRDQGKHDEAESLLREVR